MKQLPWQLDWGDAVLGIAATAYLVARYFLGAPAARLVFNIDPQRANVISLQSRPIHRWQRRLFGARVPMEDFGIICQVQAEDGRPFEPTFDSVDFEDGVSGAPLGAYATVSPSRPVQFWCRVPNAVGTYKVAFDARWSKGESHRECSLTVAEAKDGKAYNRPLIWSAPTIDL